MTWDNFATPHSIAPEDKVYHTGGIYQNNIYIFGGSHNLKVGSQAPVDKNLIYDMDANSWTYAADLPSPRLYASSAVIGNKFYVVGGQVDRTTQTSTPVNGATQLWEYDIAGDAFTSKASVPINTTTDGIFFAPKAASVGTTLWVLAYINFNGGSGAKIQLISWDQGTNSWTTGYANPPSTLYNAGVGTGLFPGDSYIKSPKHTMVSVGTDLFVCNQQIMWKFDTIGGTWTTLAAIPSGLGIPPNTGYPHGLCVWDVDGLPLRIILAPYWSGFSTFYDYEPSSDTWALGDVDTSSFVAGPGLLVYRKQFNVLYLALGSNWQDTSATTPDPSITSADNLYWNPPNNRFKSSQRGLLQLDGVRGNPFTGDIPPPPPPEITSQWRIRHNGIWLEGVPHVRKNGVWLPTSTGIRSQGTWRS